MANYDSSGAGGAFPKTRLSILEAAKSGSAGERDRALEELISAYWKPLYKYIRLKFRNSPEDAQDLTQAFFIELMERELLRRYEPEKSRLRTYLRVCMDSFALNDRKAAGRQKRGGDTAHVALDFANAEGELQGLVIDPEAVPAPETLDDYFEKEWIRHLFSTAVEELRTLSVERRKEQAFTLFERYDLDGDTASYAELAAELGLPATQVTNYLAWARREFRRLVLERLRAQCGSDEEFRREAKSLFGGSEA